MTIQKSAHLVPSTKLLHRWVPLHQFVNSRDLPEEAAGAAAWPGPGNRTGVRHILGRVRYKPTTRTASSVTNQTLTLRSWHIAWLGRRISAAVCYRRVDIGGHAVSRATRRSTVSHGSAISASTAIAITSTTKSAATTGAVVGCFIDSNRSTVKPTARKHKSQGLVRRRT